MCVAAVCISGCGQASQVSGSPGGEADSSDGVANLSDAALGQLYGGCDRDAEGSQPTIILSEVENWVQVLAVDAAAESVAEAKPAFTGIVGLTVSDTRGPMMGEKRPLDVLMHSSMLPGIIAGLAAPADSVYIGYSTYKDGDDKGRAIVMFPLVQTGTGFYVPGECLDISFRLPLESKYGESATSMLERLRSAPSGEASSILEPTSTIASGPAQSGLPVLDTPGNPADDLDTVSVLLSWPAEWLGSRYLLCTVVPARGLGTCVALSTIRSEPGGHSIPVYVDSSREVDFVLLRDDGSTTVVSELGSVRVPTDNGKDPAVSVFGSLDSAGTVSQPVVSLAST
jgi:hypothetical protein